MEFTDRYQALGIPYPDTKTMCLGDCEGVGFIPIHKDTAKPRYKILWDEAEKVNPTDDKYHFVRCPDCGGTGKRQKRPWWKFWGAKK